MRSKIACPNCGVKLYRFRYTMTDRLHGTTTEEFKIVECRGCGLYRLEPQPDPAEMHRYYPKLYWASGKTRRGIAGWYRRLVMQDHVHFLSKAIARVGVERARMLDIGCGGADLMAAMRHSKHAAIGIDVSHDALRAAGEMKVPVAEADYRQLPFAPGTFHIVSMFHLLEHVPDPEAAVRSAGELVHPNGRLIIQIPNADCWQLILLGKYWHGLDVPRHLYDYRRLDLELFLEKNGFLVVRRKYFSWRDNAPAMATSIAPWLDPIARRAKRPERMGILRLARDFAYFGLVLACMPFSIVEAIFHRGATLMVEAERIPVKRETN